MRNVRLLLGMEIVALMCSAVEAHELKVFADPAAAQVGGRASVSLSWGHKTWGADLLVDAKTLDRWELFTPSFSAIPLKKEGLSLQTNTIELKQEGVYQLVASRTPAVFTIVIDNEGNRLHKAGPKPGIKEGTIDFAQRSQQFAKGLIVAGAAKADVLKPVGLPIEIVPVQAAVDWRSGRLLQFRVLFGGKPLAGEQVLASYVGFQPENAWCYATETDRQGVAAVRVGQAGTWVLVVELRKLTTGSTRDQYDFEKYTGTLTLPVQP